MEFKWGGLLIMYGVLWFLLIVAIIVIGVIVVTIISRKFIKIEEKNLVKSSKDEILAIDNTGKSVDLIIENINEINKQTPIKFNVRGRIE